MKVTNLKIKYSIEDQINKPLINSVWDIAVLMYIPIANMRNTIIQNNSIIKRTVLDSVSELILEN